jgi:hypothetical protein
MQVDLRRTPEASKPIERGVSVLSRKVAVVLAFIGVGIFAGSAAVLPPQIGVAFPLALVLAVLVVRITWRRPEIGLVILVVGMPLQQIILARFFAWGVGTQLLGVARFWKEALLIVLFVKVLSTDVKLSRIDRLAGVYLAVTVAYLVIPLGPNTPYVRSIAAREVAAFVIVFLIARHLPIPERTSRMVETGLLVVGVALAALAFWNHFAPASWATWLDSTQLSLYRATLVDERVITPAVTYTTFAGRQFVRAGSIMTYLTLPYFLTIPVAIALARGATGRAAKWVVLAGLVCTGGILVTITRSAIGLMPFIAALALVLVKRKVRLAVVVGVLAALVIPIAASLSLTSQVRTGFDTNDESTSVHVERLGENNERLWENPGGSGLGTSAAVAQRFEVQGSITNESWYFQIATDMGFLGAISYIAFLLAILGSLAVRARRGSLSALAAVCSLTWIALGGIVLHTLSDLTTSWSIFMLAGLALRPRPTEEARDDEPAELMAVRGLEPKAGAVGQNIG